MDRHRKRVAAMAAVLAAACAAWGAWHFLDPARHSVRVRFLANSAPVAGADVHAILGLGAAEARTDTNGWCTLRFEGDRPPWMACKVVDGTNTLFEGLVRIPGREFELGVGPGGVTTRHSPLPGFVETAGSFETRRGATGTVLPRLPVAR